jgi:endonuclease/exonuclease/phosphatase family metal-dependent hydrolase
VRVTVGTFNLNNLFSRFNFRGVAVPATGEADIEATVTVDVGGPGAAPPPPGVIEPDPGVREFRTYGGRLVQGKAERDTRRIAERLLEMDLDVVALQEVEDLPTLHRFAIDFLGGRYPFRTLIDGRDPRLIDVAVISKLPFGGITSWQFTPHPSEPNGRPVFSRDCLEVEVLRPSGSRRLFTLYVNHLKSKFVQARSAAERAQLEAEADETRRRQAETVADIVRSRQRTEGRALVLGDMNDAPDAPPLASFAAAGWTNGLTNPVERGGSPNFGAHPPPSTAWTHRFTHSGQVDYTLFDHIWLTPGLALRQVGAGVLRRRLLTRDGSDHDPAWVELDV